MKQVVVKTYPLKFSTEMYKRIKMAMLKDGNSSTIQEFLHKLILTGVQEIENRVDPNDAIE